MVKRGKSHEAFPLRTVSRLTGLTPDLIRAWEKRYGVVAPLRGPRGARLYSSADVSHLSLLARVVESGRAIGDVARLEKSELEGLMGASPDAPHAAEREARAVAQGPVVPAALELLRQFDASGLERLLGDALLAHGIGGFVRQVAVPLLHEVGERWSRGLLTVAEEHLISGLLRSQLSGLIRNRGSASHPAILLATPSGERHEFGLLLAALTIVDDGMGVYYLGTDLPAAEIAAAAHRTGVLAVGLGLVNGDNRVLAVDQVRLLEGLLPSATELWLGGREARAVKQNLKRSRAIVLDDLDTMKGEVTRLRALAAARGGATRK